MYHMNQRLKHKAAVPESSTMAGLDSDKHDQVKASGSKSTTEKACYEEDTSAFPVSLLDVFDLCDPFAWFQTRSMAPNPVTPSLAVHDPKCELEYTIRSPDLSITEPMVSNHDRHYANDFSEEWFSSDYNSVLDATAMDALFLAEDRDTSTPELNPTPTIGGFGQWPCAFSAPTTLGETALFTSPTRGTQGSQAVPNMGHPTLSAASRIAGTPARDIKNQSSDIVNTSSFAGLSSGLREGPVTEVQSTPVLPPKDTVPLPRVTSSAKKTQGGSKRKPCKEKDVHMGREATSATQTKCGSKRKPYEDEDVLMGRGGNATHHPGNQKYLAAMKRRLLQYHSSSKTEKTKVSQYVVDEVHAWGGRFLNKVSKNKCIEEDDKRARKRVSQALRDCKPPE
jgi:hypothetical protein